MNSSGSGVPTPSNPTNQSIISAARIIAPAAADQPAAFAYLAPTKMTRGKQKINTEVLIPDKQKRQTTFYKRKSGLIKKAKELHTLTGSEVLLVFSKPGKSGSLHDTTSSTFSFASPTLGPLVEEVKGRVESIIELKDTLPSLSSRGRGASIGGLAGSSLQPFHLHEYSSTTVVKSESMDDDSQEYDDDSQEEESSRGGFESMPVMGGGPQTGLNTRGLLRTIDGAGLHLNTTGLIREDTRGGLVMLRDPTQSTVMPSQIMTGGGGAGLDASSAVQEGRRQAQLTSLNVMQAKQPAQLQHGQGQPNRAAQLLPRLRQPTHPFGIEFDEEEEEPISSANGDFFDFNYRKD